MKLIIIITIVFCSGYFFSITALGSTITIIIMTVCSLAIVFMAILRKKRNPQETLLIDRKTLALTTYQVTIVIMLSGISSVSIKQVVLCCCAMLIVSVYDWHNFKIIYIKVMAVISCFSLFGFAVQHSSLINLLPTIVNYNGIEYINGILFSIIKYKYSGPTERLHGLFWEPGLFATYLAIAIIFINRENTKRYWLTLVLFVVCLIMTKSGAGIAMMPLILISKLTEKRNLEFSLIKKVIFCVSVIMLFAIVQIGTDIIKQWINNYLFVKLNDTSNISNFMRTNSILVDLQIAWNHFPFGVGITQYATEVAKFSSTFPSSGTSTITMYLAEYGVFGIPIIAIWFVALFKISDSQNFIAKLAIFLIFLIILTKEPHGNLLFMNCILMYSSIGYRSEKELVNMEEKYNALIH